ETDSISSETSSKRSKDDTSWQSQMEAEGGVSDWTKEQVCQWLSAIDMDKYVPDFLATDINGVQLLQIDGTRLKEIGVSNSNDKTFIKKKITELKKQVDKDRKLKEKEQKAREKLEKKGKVETKKKKFPFIGKS
ncbi:unnamed protein product, partial [Owenia fusiformis]